MRSLIRTTVAVIGVAMMAGAAQAADIIEEPVFIEPAPPEPVLVEAAGGFYIRGDIGYVDAEKTSGRYKFLRRSGHPYEGTGYGYPGDPDYKAPLHDAVYEEHHYDSIELEKAFSVGGGLGYRFNDFARVDVTAEYFKGDLRGTSACVGYYAEDCRYSDKSEAGVWTVMANAYVDIAKFGSVTPYLGAGAGFAHVKYDTLNNTFKCGTDVAVTNGFPCGETYNHEGYGEWRFAASLMAGASVDITQNLKFDAGYKYTRIGDGEAFGWDKEDRDFGASGVQSHDNGYDIHAIRAGLRYEFGGGGFGKGKGVEHQASNDYQPYYAPGSFEPAPVYK